MTTAPQPPTPQKDAHKPAPDQATIDALLEMTRMDYERRNSQGRTAKHWWNLSEWMNASPAGRRSLWIRLGIAVFITILLTLLTQYVVSHSGVKVPDGGAGI